MNDQLREGTMNLNARESNLLAYLKEQASARPPDQIIGEPDDPYLLRWWLVPRNGVANVYLHKFCKSDDDRALHDHPFDNTSVILEGSYLEVMPYTGQTGVSRWASPSHVNGATTCYALRRAGESVMRRAEDAHRIMLTNGPVWSLFTTGPRRREWGFYCERGWVHWADFTAARDGQAGRGCE